MYDPESDVGAARRGDREATGRILSHMTAACKDVASYYTQRFSHLNFDDIVQEGYLAVMRAIKRWDKDREAKFTTYAFQAIRNRAWIMARRTPVLSQLVDGGRAGGPAARSHDGSIVDSRVVLEELAVDKSGESDWAAEAFGGLSFDHCRVLHTRLNPLIEGRKVRSWRVVSQIENIPIARCKALFAEAVEIIREAHGDGH